MKQSITRFFLFQGLLIPFIFWLSVIVAGMQNENYSHVRDTISALGAIGAKSENLMEISTWLCSLLSIPFLIGLFNVCHQEKLKKAPLLGIVGFTVMLGWAAFYHSGNPMHSKSGPILLLLLLGPLLAAILWKRKGLKNLRILSLISFFIMLFILIRAIPSETIQMNYTGLIQRFVHFGWTVWFIALSLGFLRLLNISAKK
ncbi:DUF998 domain-containing protein [Flavobacterium ginsenosidimutans]|uniref:DUF998 domain-containing protein n=1 Tax=Flavobacterium ginsenosidimutans TaxID=687844 RepID=A0ABZ2Q3A2_9FLAO